MVGLVVVVAILGLGGLSFSSLSEERVYRGYRRRRDSFLQSPSLSDQIRAWRFRRLATCL